MSKNFEINISLTQIMGGLVFLGLSWAAWTFAPQILSALPGSGGHNMVTVDVVRIVNAQRKMMSSTLIQSNEESVRTVAYAGRNATQVIQDVAGPNTIVLVKQSVVTSTADIQDITDAVLKRLGLDTDMSSIEAVPSEHYFKGNEYSTSKLPDLFEDDLEKRLQRYNRILKDDQGGAILP